MNLNDSELNNNRYGEIQSQWGYSRESKNRVVNFLTILGMMLVMLLYEVSC